MKTELPKEVIVDGRFTVIRDVQPSNTESESELIAVPFSNDTDEIIVPLNADTPMELISEGNAKAPDNAELSNAEAPIEDRLSKLDMDVRLLQR